MIGVVRPTAQSVIDALVERGDLREVTGRARRRVYETPAIFEAVYRSFDAEESTIDLELPPGFADPKE